MIHKARQVKLMDHIYVKKGIFLIILNETCLNTNEPSISDLIDQCRSGPCPINSDCTSHFTGVHCDCHQGYSASGPQPLESCDDIDECVLEYGSSISPCVDLAT